MDNRYKHDRKKNTNTSLVAIHAGAGGLGIGGFVLVGGALVTAAIVSALAFRSRSQRRSSSENMKNKMSQSPSPSSETLSVDAPNKLDLMMNTDFPPSEEVVTVQTENIHSLTPDKKHDYEINNEQVHNGDTNEPIIDSAFESEEQKHLIQVDDEHVDENSLVSDEGVISVEEYEAVEVPVKDIDVAEALKNEDEVHQETVEDNLHDEIIIDNCEGDLSDETGYADQIVPEVVMEEEQEAVDGQDEIIWEKFEEDLSSKKGPADQIMREVASDAQEMQVNQVCETFVVACVMNRLKEAVDDQTAANEDAPRSQLTNDEEKDKGAVQKVEELVSVDDEAAEVDDQTDNSLRKMMSKDEITHAEFVMEDEDNEEDVTLKVKPGSGVGSCSVEEEPTPEAKISHSKIEETAVQVKVEMITEHELVQKYEIPHMESVKRDEDGKEDVTAKAELSSGVGSSFIEDEPTPEAKVESVKEVEEIEIPQELVMQVEVEMITEHELVKKYEIPQVESVKEVEEIEEDVTAKVELSFGVGSFSIEKEPTPEAKISNHKIKEMVVQVKGEMIKDHESVKKDENSHYVKEDEDNEEDVAVKAKLSSGVSSSSIKEEPTPEAKINNHKLTETVMQVKGEMIKDHELVKKDENPHVDVKEDEDDEEDVGVKAKLSSGVGSSSTKEEPTPEAKINNHKLTETVMQVKGEMIKDHELVKKDENPHVDVNEDEDNEEDVAVKAKLGSGVSSSSIKEEPTPEAKINNHKVTETVMQVKGEMIKDRELVKKDENPYVEHVKEDEDNEDQDVTIKPKLNSGGSISSFQEKQTPEAKITNHNRYEKQTFLCKNHSDGDDKEVIKEHAFASEPWNLKLIAWSVLIQVCCLCHWYFELPFPGLSLVVGCFLFILICFGYCNRATYSVKYE